ncbi:DNA-methyltransferase [Levilactobacillus namurensis]|uniref:Methyltransferase n=1 Tax=Levilactobacillus namurensis TaxID=380393 RepID=A0AAW8W7P6_9LACO|nr:site-specific DNA-methyltransferase [Levilactobacillus namurensis]MDT7015404.1 site-specific DNA-methyltransferase [Levilactobacillus namurensis]
MIDLKNGDCLELMKEIPDGSVDMVLCDLPYGITSAKWDLALPMDKLWSEYNRILKADGNILLFSSMPFLIDLINSNRKHFKYLWHWNKENAGNIMIAKYQPRRVIEYVANFTKGRGKYFPIMENTDPSKMRPAGVSKTGNNPLFKVKSKKYKPSIKHSGKVKFPDNILTYNSRMGELNPLHRVHPTQKPVALLEYLIKTYTNPGDLVLDNCMGSGSTGVACVNSNRRFIGMELDKNYFKIAEQRINEARHNVELF